MTQEITTQVVLRGMDSREIAQLTGKRHDHVCRDILRMLEELEIPAPKFGAGYLDAQNQRRRCFVLPKRECLILASGYSVVLRAKIIDRWIELETQFAAQKQAAVPQHQIPQTYAEALRLAADLSDKVDEQAKQIESQTKQIEAAQPAVQFVERYVEAKQTQSIRAVAKILGVPEQAFIARLVADKILYRLSGRLMPSADQMAKHYWEVKTGEVRGIAFAQPKVTPRGVEYLARCVARWQRDARSQNLRNLLATC